jgi:hypothetical protein
VWDAVETVTRRYLAQYIKRLCDRGAAFGVAADGSWNKARNAQQHVLVLLHNELTVHIICVEKSVMGEGDDGKEVVVSQGNYEGHSKGMESAAWDRMAAELDAMDRRFCNLVGAVCVDRDASVTTTIAVGGGKGRERERERERESTTQRRTLLLV